MGRHATGGFALLMATLVLAGCGASVKASSNGAAKPAAAPAHLYAAELRGMSFSGNFSESIQLLDFAPGAWTPVHVNPGPGLATVLAGSLTLRTQGVDRVIRAGSSFSVPPEQAHQVGNTSGADAQMMVVHLIPVGTDDTTLPSKATSTAIRPSKLYSTQTDGLHWRAPFVLETEIVDFASGAWTPKHTATGFGLLLVIQGQVEVRTSGSDRIYYAGDLIRVNVGTVHQVGDPAATPARVIKVTLGPASSK
jgi:quercetin dioxygenase-like cupin family protein